MEDTITNDLNKILGQVLTGDCAKWLTGADFSASDLIPALETSSASGGPTYGYGVVSDPTNAAFVSYKNSDGSLIQGLPQDAQLTVNSNGAFFSSNYTVGSGFVQYVRGTLKAQIFILVHELAHMVGASGFMPDAGSPSTVNKNNSLVQQNCGKQIAGVK